MTSWQTTSTLLDHQKRAVKKLIRSRVSGLFMEMGTGKTRCAIEFACLRQSRIDKVIWFCPVSLKETIRYEIRKHTDSDSICVFNDSTNTRNAPKVFWYIVGIESMSASNRIVLTIAKLMTVRTFAVVDESSYIKGHRSLRTQRITDLSKKARYRMILTGTPMSQGVVDLFAQMRFLSPKILGYHSFYSFAANHLEYSEKYKGLIIRAHNTGYLAAKIQPYVYQVTKAECLDLPPKLYDSRYYGMTNEQWEAYEQAKWEILMSIEDDEIDSYTIFRLFTALQQIVCGFWNREGKLLEFPHFRLDILQGIIKDIPTNNKIIIWSKYRYNIRAIVKMLSNCYGSDSVAQFHGGLGEKERNQEIDYFRNSFRFLVASPACGGHGLNLIEAHYVAFYDNEFKYANRLQAEDRPHRIGQTMPVTYIDVICRHSIDEQIAESQAKKSNTVDDFKRKVEAVKDKGKKDLKKLIESL